MFFAVHGRAALPLGLAAACLLALGAARAAGHGEGRRALALRLFGPLAPCALGFVSAANALTLAAVIAVLGSVGHAATGLPAWVWSLLSAAGAAATAAGGGTRQRAVQAVLLALVLLAAVPVTALGAFRQLHALRIAMPDGSSLLGAFGFCAYNVILAVDGIAAVHGGEGRSLGAAMGGLIVGLLLTLEATALALSPAAVRGAELPLLALGSTLHGELGALLAAAITLAGISAAASFTAGLGQAVRSPWTAALAGYLGSLLGVGTLIDRGYPVMAILAAAWLLRLLTARGPVPPERKEVR